MNSQRSRLFVCNIPKLSIKSLVELGRLTKQTDHNVDTVRAYIKGV